MDHKKIITIGLVVVVITIIGIAIYVVTRPKKSDPKPVVNAVQKSSADTTSAVISAGNNATNMLSSGTSTDQVKAKLTNDLVNAVTNSQTAPSNATNTLSPDTQSKVAPVVDNHNTAVVNVVSDAITKINNIDDNATPADAANTIKQTITPAVQQIQQITKNTTDNLNNTISPAPANQQTPVSGGSSVYSAYPINYPYVGDMPQKIDTYIDDKNCMKICNQTPGCDAVFSWGFGCDMKTNSAGALTGTQPIDGNGSVTYWKGTSSPPGWSGKPTSTITV